MLELAIKVALCTVFSLVAYSFKMLNRGGAIAALVLGAVILWSQGIPYFILLLIFFVLGAMATRYKNSYKRVRLHERGTRKAMNVIANGLIPASLAAFSLLQDLTTPYVTAIAVALSDTFASELGVLSNNPYMITTFKKTEPGTNGAISLLGEGAAFLGAAIISVCGFFLLGLSLFDTALCVAFGLLGCHIDSLLGATFQGKYKGTMNGTDTILTNSDVNLISISLASLLAFIVVTVPRAI